MKLLMVVCITLLQHLSHCQEIEDIRLADGIYGDFMGRVELLVNGTWGTICNDAWNYPDARAACRMLGLTTVACVAHGPAFGDAEAGVPVVMQDVRCRGSENDLNECRFELAAEGLPVNETCEDGSGAGAVCVRLPREIGEPTNVTQLNATSTTVTIGFQLPPVPDGVTRFRFRLQLDSGDFSYCYADNDGTTVFNCTLSELSPNSTYRILVRLDVVYSVCSQTGYLYGNNSEFIEARTSAPRAPPPSVPYRLVPPRADVIFMGRLEVMYNNTWGTVCDDAFQSPEANVACETLGYPQAMCYVREARFGQGSGPIWIDNLDCTRSHDVLSECDHNGWGVHNCDHTADVGVICWPDEYNLPVSGVSIRDATGRSITVTWEPYSFPPLTSAAGYQLSFSSDRSTSNVNLESSTTLYTIGRLQTNTTYAIRVRAQFHYSEYCISRSFRRTQWSTRVRATTVDTAPSAPPTSFHVVVLNSTAIEFQWELPPTEFQNGIIRGYKVFIREQGSSTERMMDVPDGNANEFIMTGLTAGTAYVCSMLAYTSADGPRTLFLTASTYENDFIPLIIYFGINGDGLDRATKQLNSEEDVSIHCDTGISNVTTNWFFSNGTLVGTTDRNVRQASYPNGTTVLQIANNRPLDYCDAGVYTCRAVSSTDEVQERSFKLFINNAPPTPGIAYALGIGSSWITIAWRDLECDGGHRVVGQNIRYSKDFANFILPSNFFIYNINASLRQYTIQNLEPSTSYNISIQAVSADFRVSDYSEGNIITTLPEAPSPPRSVRARLVSAQQSLIEVSWREPAATNGIISQYTLFVTSSGVSTSDGDGGIAINEVETFNKTYPGHIGAANVTVSNTEVTYTFQVRASNLVNGIQNHGEFSQVTPESTLFVPSLNLPIPQNVSISESTNSTITLSWDYPPPPSVPINGFQIVYSARVEWVSPQQTLVMFDESGVTTTPTNRVTFSQLTPGTTYRFRVSAITQDEEQGTEVVISGTTTEATRGRLAYIQLRISPVASCYFWQERSAERISFIRNSLLTQLNGSLCPSCLLSNRTITDEELSCRERADQVVFRARIIGNSQYSASGLVDLLQSWVASGRASVSVNSVRYHIDPTCLTSLDSLSASDCAITMTTTTLASPTTPSSPPTTSSSNPNTPPPPVTTRSSPRSPPPITTRLSPQPPAVSVASQTGISNGEVAGLIIGVIIAVLLLLFIALVVLLIYRTTRSTYGTKPIVDESSVIFSDIKDSEDDVDVKTDFGNHGSNGDTTGL